MENVKLPYYGETVWVIKDNQVKETKVKKVTYIDFASERKVITNTGIGEYRLYEIYDTKSLAENVLKHKNNIAIQ